MHTPTVIRATMLVLALMVALMSCDPDHPEQSDLATSDTLVAVDYNEVFDADTVAGIPIVQQNIGYLHLPTGKIVACDPLVNTDTQAFTRRVPPGRYPVQLYIAKTGTYGDRCAIVRLMFSSARAVQWIPATTTLYSSQPSGNGQDIQGFPVDSGTGSLADVETQKNNLLFLSQFADTHPQANIYNDLLAPEFKKSAQSADDIGMWANFHLPDTSLNIIMFQTGYGDGDYPCYWGIDKDNNTVSLVVDLMVLFGEPDI